VQNRSTCKIGSLHQLRYEGGGGVTKIRRDDPLQFRGKIANRGSNEERMSHPYSESNIVHMLFRREFFGGMISFSSNLSLSHALSSLFDRFQ
jgi:hypothetical protein